MEPEVSAPREDRSRLPVAFAAGAGGATANFWCMHLTCISRFVDVPSRSTPPSIFADLGAIGERMREIQGEEKPSEPKDDPS